MAVASSRCLAARAPRRDGRPLLEYLTSCCHRISECEPHVRAFLPESARTQRILAEGAKLPSQSPGPLHGLLLGVKDNIAARGFPTLCGSAVPPELHKLPAEAEVVRRLLDAGMVLAGKTSTAEFAHVDPPSTANPWNLDHTPGGSSSGSAAAVAAGMVHVAIGTQTIGSVNRPAAFCGICGYKPSYARVPTDGVAVLSPSADTVGFFTAAVADMFPIAETAIGSANWKATATEVRRFPVLGVPDGAYLKRFADGSLESFREMLVDLQEAGVTVRPVKNVLDNIEAVAALHIGLTSAEWAESLAGRWETHASLFRAKSAMEMIAAKQVPLTEVEAGRRSIASLRGELEALMDKEGIDLWVTPGTLQGAAPRTLESTGNSSGQLPWMHAGLPMLTLPAGFCSKVAPLPLALQLIGRFGRDEELIGYGAKLETLGLAQKMRLLA